VINKQNDVDCLAYLHELLERAGQTLKRIEQENQQNARQMAEIQAAANEKPWVSRANVSGKSPTKIYIDRPTSARGFLRQLADRSMLENSPTQDLYDFPLNVEDESEAEQIVFLLMRRNRRDSTKLPIYAQEMLRDFIARHFV
jgi:hypothetical protein